MGIRWYGWAITSAEATQARADPWPVIRLADDRYDSPDWAVTDFDKAWRPMQILFSDPRREGTFAPRPAYSLVAGDVHYLPDGAYREHVGILTARQVREISDDLQTVTDADVRAFDRFECSNEQPLNAQESYLAHFVDKAKEFVADAASRGHCVIYLIR